MTEKLVEIKDLEISFGEGSKKFVAVKMPISSLIREKHSLLLVNQEVGRQQLDVRSSV